MLSNNKNIINRKIILLSKGFNLTTLAHSTGYSIPSICIAVKQGKKQSRTLHDAIVSVLGVSLAEFWPELYGADIVNNNSNKVSHDATVSGVASGVN